MADFSEVTNVQRTLYSHGKGISVPKGSILSLTLFLMHFSVQQLLLVTISAIP